MIKVGLTGAIAAGKSEVEKILQEKFLVIDLDIISHEILENSAKKEVLEEFRTLNRKEIGKIVFSDENKRKKLEEIIHPKLKNFILETFEKNKNEKAIVISGALLYEAGFFSLFDKTIFIDAPFDLRLKRLQKRNSLSEKEALKRINSQTDAAKDFCDIAIENAGSIEDLREKILKIPFLKGK